jgi:predicted RNA-binding protein with PUA-like domain
MNHWLVKSEPSVWSFDDQKKAGIKGTVWDGVRNYQASNYLKQMKIGDLCFFYHSNEDKKIIGIVKIIKSAFIDPTDKEKRFVAVQLAYSQNLNEPVSLADIKENKEISHLPLIKQSRLSVMPIDSKSWKIICKMGRI